MAVRPLQWRLPKLSRADLQLEAGVRGFFPTTAMQDAAAVGIRKVLIEHLGQDVLFFLEDISATPFGHFLDRASEASVLVQLGVAPQGAKAVLQIDHELAALIVNRMLGGEGEREVEPIPLTETEQGVLQFLLMKSLAAVHKACGRSTKYHFRFERILHHPEAIEKHFAPTEMIVVTQWRLGFGDRVGFLRIVVPASLLQVVGSAERRARTTGLKTRAAAFGSDAFEFWADGGRCALTAEDIVALEVGDVVLFDETTLALANGRPSGDVILRVGTGEVGGLRCQLDPKTMSRCVVKGMT